MLEGWDPLFWSFLLAGSLGRWNQLHLFLTSYQISWLLAHSQKATRDSEVGVLSSAWRSRCGFIPFSGLWRSWPTLSFLELFFLVCVSHVLRCTHFPLCLFHLMQTKGWKEPKWSIPSPSFAYLSSKRIFGHKGCRDGKGFIYEEFPVWWEKHTVQGMLQCIMARTTLRAFALFPAAPEESLQGQGSDGHLYRGWDRATLTIAMYNAVHLADAQ